MHTNSTATYDKQTHTIIYTDLPILYEEVRNTFSKVSCDLTAQHKYQLFIYDIANFISSAEKEYEYVSNIKREIDKSLNDDIIVRDTELLYRPAIIKLHSDINITVSQIIATNYVYKREIYKSSVNYVAAETEALEYDLYRQEEDLRQCKRKRV
jgi:hypothetical protein